MQNVAEAGRGLRVLIVAENISLNQSGETSVPYNYLERFHAMGLEVQAICHARVRDDLRATMAPELFERIGFVEDTALQRWLHAFGKRFPYRIEDLIFNQLIYLVTQRRLRGRAIEIVRERSIDVVLQPVPISPKTPSFMYGLGVPVVIGPMCGGLELPPGFRHLDSRFTTLAIKVARWLTPILHMWAPGKKEAAALLVGNQRTARALPAGVTGTIHEVVESGAVLDRWEPKVYPAPQCDTVRFVFVGRLVDWKGAQYLVKAFARIAGKGGMHLDLVGDGELLEEIRASVTRLGLDETVTVHGRVPLERSIELMRDADVYVKPSLRECGGLALLDAMALGLPIIACNWMGPAEYLTPESGILVDPDSEEALVSGLASAMLRLAESPDLRRRLGEGAKARVHAGLFGWGKKSARVAEVLHEVAAAGRTNRKDRAA